MTHCPAPVSPLLRNIYGFGFGFVVIVFMFANKTLNSAFKKGSERRDKRALMVLKTLDWKLGHD